MGGLHRFTGWDGHFLTDSGGYQVMSLPCSLDDDGVTFRSSYDGSWQRLTPEGAVAAQEALGADIQMVLDVCTELPASREAVVEAGERTLAWAERARRVRSRPGQLLFGIVQGGVELDLRAEYAEALVGIGFDGYAIGGLSVGEQPTEMLAAVDAASRSLPADSPRYLMGVGDPAAVLARSALGVDMFDCVLPTRLGRHGTALTSSGRLAVKAARLRQGRLPARTQLATARSVGGTAGLTCVTFSTSANQAPAGSSACTTWRGWPAWSGVPVKRCSTGHSGALLPRSPASGAHGAYSGGP